MLTIKSVIKISLVSLLFAGVITIIGCSKEETVNNEELFKKAELPGWLDFLIKKLPPIEVEFGQNKVINGEYFRCVDGNLCIIKIGLNSSSVDTWTDFDEDENLRMVFLRSEIPQDKEQYLSGDFFNVTTQIIISDSLLDAASEDYIIDIGDYPIIYSDDDYCAVLF